MAFLEGMNRYRVSIKGFWILGFGRISLSFLLEIKAEGFSSVMDLVEASRERTAAESPRKKMLDFSEKKTGIAGWYSRRYHCKVFQKIYENQENLLVEPEPLENFPEEISGRFLLVGI